MDVREGLPGSIGNTPLIRLNWASEQTGCTILGKAEFMNPGGSVKDRAALAMIEAAEKSGALEPGGLIVEGTAGNTGIGLALVGAAKGYKTLIVMPATQSREKQDMIRLCGAELMLVAAVPYKNPENYVRKSGAIAQEKGAFWANQFDNLDNRTGHYTMTGPEIWTQTGGRIDGFTCAVGTGGTLAGVGQFLKERNADVKIVLSDPFGSALYHYYAHGELKAEGDSITEGIGQGRITRNLEDAPIDAAQRVSDEEALDAIYNMVLHDGLVMGGSAGINVAGAMKLAREMGPGKTIVTILCDSGQRYQSKIFNPEFLTEKGLPLPPWLQVVPGSNNTA